MVSTLQAHFCVQVAFKRASGVGTTNAFLGSVKREPALKFFSRLPSDNRVHPALHEQTSFMVPRSESCRGQDTPSWKGRLAKG